MTVNEIVFSRSHRILGIDPGSRVAGFACLDSKAIDPVRPNDFFVIAAGALRTNVRDCITRRIGYMHDSLTELIKEYQPKYCVIEKAFCGNNVSSALRLGEVRGAMIASIRRCGLEVMEITPAEVKKSIAGNGRASKEEVKIAVQELLRLGENKLPYDVTDALAIALTFGLGIPDREGRSGKW